VASLVYVDTVLGEQVLRRKDEKNFEKRVKILETVEKEVVKEESFAYDVAFPANLVAVLYFIGCLLSKFGGWVFSYARGKMRFLSGSRLLRCPGVYV